MSVDDEVEKKFRKLVERKYGKIRGALAVIQRLKEVAEECSISTIVVNEAFTSKTCPLCGQRHKNRRIFRGLFKCHREGVVMNADLVGAFNILKKAGRV